MVPPVTDTQTVVREVFTLTRALAADTVVLQLQEAKDLLAAVQDMVVEHQVRAPRCPSRSGARPAETRAGVGPHVQPVDRRPAGADHPGVVLPCRPVSPVWLLTGCPPDLLNEILPLGPGVILLGLRADLSGMDRDKTRLTRTGRESGYAGAVH